MNRVDVVDLVVDLVDVDLDVDLVDVDLVDVDLVDVDLVDVDLERAIDKKEIKTRAPDFRLTHRLVQSAIFFKTKTSKTLLRLNCIQKAFKLYPKSIQKFTNSDKKPDCGTPENYIFEIFKGIGPQLRSQILI